MLKIVIKKKKTVHYCIIYNILILNVSVQLFTSYVKSTNLKSSPLFDNIEFNFKSIYHQNKILNIIAPLTKVFSISTVNNNNHYVATYFDK